MKLIYGTFFAITAVVLTIVFILSRKNKQPYVIRLRLAILCAIIATLSNLMMLSDDYQIALCGTGMFYASMDYLLIAFLEYVLGYTDLFQEHKLVRRHIILILAILDSCSLLSNFKTQKTFSLMQTTSPNGEIVYDVTGYSLLQVHLIFCYILAGIIALALIYKSFKVATYYRRKYLMILLMFLIAVAIDGIYVMTEASIDIGVMMYALASITIFYYTTVFAPKEILTDSVKSLVRELVDYVFIFDMDDQCIYINDTAKHFMGTDPDVEAKRAIAAFRQMYPEKKYSVFSIEQTINRNGQEYIMKMNYQQILDKRGTYAGCSVIVEDRTDAVRKEREAFYKTTHDYLTGIYNKDYFLTKAREMLDENKMTRYCVVVSDIENFKLVNDVFGQDAGNEILIRIAQEIEKRIKPADLYGRLDGDKFAILMPMDAFREDYFIRETDMKVDVATISNFPLNIYLGVYEVTNREHEITAMCDRAILAINSIKGSNSKRIAYYDESIRENILLERDLVNEMGTGIANKEFVLFLQPQVNEKGNVLGAEALVRWQHPTRGLLFPGSFIEVFEKRGVITRLDEYVWECACEKLADWKKRGIDKYLSVNISAQDMYALNIYQVFTCLVKKYDISPQALHLEITETAVMMNLEQQLELIRSLRNYGFEVEMDDFGSGYSSLNMLKNMDLDVLKIDMKFLGRSDDMDKGRKILRAVVQMAEDIGMEQIVEGVEEEEELNFLTSIGCKKFQGYYFAKPMPIPQFESQYLNIL